MALQDDSEAGKIFVGGLSWETTEDGLKNYFQTNFGEVSNCIIMRDIESHRSRGFGFVTFRDPTMVQKVLGTPKHILDDREIDPKAAVPRGSGPPPSSGRGGAAMGRGRGGAGGQNWRQMNSGINTPYQGRTKKIFVGGIGHGTTEDDVKAYFITYGNVSEVIIKYDQKTNRMRGFGFVSFDTEDSVDKLCEIHFHTINGKTVEVKKAEPRQQHTVGAMHGQAAFGMGRGGPSYGNDPYPYANSYGQHRGFGQAAGYGAPQPYGAGYAPSAAGYGQGPYGGPASSGYGYSQSGYGQSAPSFNAQYGQAASYGPGPNQGYGSQAQASGYESYGTGSSQPSQGQDYNSTGTSTYNYGGAAGRIAGYGQEQSPYGTPQTGAYGQDRSAAGAYSGQPGGYSQTQATSGSAAASATADTSSYSQQTGSYGQDFRSPQGFGQGAASGPQQARPYGGYQ